MANTWDEDMQKNRIKRTVHNNVLRLRSCAAGISFAPIIILLGALLLFPGCGGNQPAGEREAHLPVSQLQERLLSTDPVVRLGAAQGLRRHGTEAVTALTDLTKALRDDNDVRVRQAAALALGQIGPSAASAVSDLIQVLQKDGDAALRRQCAAALGKIGPAAKAALPLLTQMTQTGPSIVRPAARDAIQQIQAANSKK